MVRARDILRVMWKHGRIRRQGIEAIHGDRDERLQKLVAHARESSPFYRRLYSGLPGGRLALGNLPIVDKKMLMESFDESLTTRRVRKEDVVEWTYDLGRLGQVFDGAFLLANTSGTSGYKGYFVFGLDEWVETVGLVYLRLGRRMPLAGTSVLSLLPFTKTRVASIIASRRHCIDILYYLHTPRVRRYMVDSKLVDITTPIPRMVEMLNAFQPHLLTSYPTAVEALAREARAGSLRVKLRAIFCFSEPLTDGARAFIEETFHCDVYNFYGSTETWIIAKDCSSKRMHVLDDVAILEPIQKDGSPTPAGRASDSCLVTSLTKFAQPILRYELGDSIIPLDERCPCGSPLPVIQVIGRQEDVFWIEDGRGGHVPLLPIATGIQLLTVTAVQQYQIRQEERDRIRVLFVPETPADEATCRERIQSNFDSFLREHGLDGCARVEAERVDEIPRGPSGKLRRIVSLVGPPKR